MKMKKFLGMMLLAGAVATATTSCDKGDDEGGNNTSAIDGTYQGSVQVILADQEMEVDSVSVKVLTAAGKTGLTATIKLPTGMVIPVAVELTDLTSKQVSVDVGEGTVSVNATLFKIPKKDISVPLGATASATLALEGYDLEEMTPDAKGYHGFGGEATMEGETSTGLSAALAGTATGLPDAGDTPLPILIFLNAQK